VSYGGINTTYRVGETSSENCKLRLGFHAVCIEGE
jgi:hypothetical protein